MAWIPTRMLDPNGMTAPRLTTPPRPTLCLIAFCLLLWVPGFFSIPTSDRDEGRFAQATKQMLETGDFVNIRFGTEARNRKPIGIHWLQAPFAAAARAAGLATANPIWPYRVPSALGALAAVLAVFRLGRRMAGDGPAWLAAAMLASCTLLVAETHFAKTDAALLGCATVAMLLLARAYVDPAGFSAAAAAGFWALMGAAVLIKGPVAPAVAGLTAIALVIADRRAGWLRALRAGWGIALLLLIALPWFVAIGIATHGQFFQDSVGRDFAGKLTGGAENHWGPPGLYLLVSPALLFPATIPVILALPAIWRNRAEPLTRFLIAWVVPFWLVLEAAPTKLPHYALPLFPALLLAAARWLAAPERAAPSRYWTRFAVGAGLVVAALFGVAGITLPAVLHADIWRGIPTLLATGALFWLALSASRAADWPGLRRMVLAMPLLTWAVLEILLPAMDPVWLSPQIVRALAAQYPNGRPPGSFGAVGFHEPSLVFLAGTDTVLLGLQAEPAARFLAEAPDRSLLIAERQRAEFLQAAAGMGLAPRAVAHIKGINYAGGRSETLTLYVR